MMKPLQRSALGLACMLLSGCASYLVRSAEAEPVGSAGQPFRHDSTSIAGAAGLSTDGPGYVTRDTCRSANLAQVEVRRNVGQTILTILTLGIVSPATIYYLCEKPKPPPPCNCSQDPNL
jgi:curli biogenesis system outer membrane secretion channel CsgG